MCRYQLARTGLTNDWRRCLEALESARTQAGTLPAALEEELAFAQIDALYQARRLDSPEALKVVTEFQGAFPGSARAQAVNEYELAARFELGFGRVYDAALGEHKPFSKTWTNGLAQLEGFLARLREFPANEYRVLIGRSLAEETQLALRGAAGKHV